MWRVGRKVGLNVYDGDRPVCQCHTVEDALFIITAGNQHLERIGARDGVELLTALPTYGLYESAQVFSDGCGKVEEAEALKVIEAEFERAETVRLNPEMPE